LPVIDFYYPSEVFSRGQLETLANALSESLKHCAHAIDNPRADAINWLYLHEQSPESIFVAGVPERKAHYRIEVSLLVGMMDEGTRASIAEEMTHQVLGAEGTAFNPLSASRVWVLFHEIPEGYWASSGRLQKLADLMDYLNRPVDK
jgi:phenylpyruvate tautomerase PptA (4-oxalocrotonate tautomerase family)